MSKAHQCIVFMGILLLSQNVFSQFKLNLLSKMHYRDSDQTKSPVNFPFPSIALPVGANQAFLETVDKNQHWEISTITLNGKWKISDLLQFKFKIDAIDKYERNPTSDDHEFDIDEFILRAGRKSPVWESPDETNYYVEIGKFGKFERQNDRHLESYGLVSTAFNRLEDSGLMFGMDLSSGFYLISSVTTGNPVFFRDSNALAGDNGTDSFRVPPNINPNPAIKNGFPILYDAEIEAFNLTSNPELGLGLGFRFGDPDQFRRANILLWSYQRKLAAQRDLHGTFYGADLDLFSLDEIPGIQGIRLPFQGDKKTEYGANLWLYYDDATVFMQYVRQDIAALIRHGWEIEMAYAIQHPFEWAFNEQPIINRITPVLRLSILDPKFTGDSRYPAPSVWWDWKKIDIGLSVHILKNFRLTLEHSFNLAIIGEPSNPLNIRDRATSEKKFSH